MNTNQVKGLVECIPAKFLPAIDLLHHLGHCDHQQQGQTESQAHFADMQSTKVPCKKSIS